MNTFETVVDGIIETLDVVIIFILALAVVSFLYGIVTYIFRAGDETKRKEGVRFITYGIIGLFVMISVWGLVALLSNTIGASFGIPKIV